MTYTVKVPLCGAVTRYLKVDSSAHARRGPVGAGRIEALERLVARAAQLAVRDQFPVAGFYRVADPHAVPVVERLGAVGVTAAAQAADLGFSGPSA